MAYAVIKGPRELHSARTPEQYISKHSVWIERRKAEGHRVEPHLSHEPIAASVDRLSGWIVRCDCGSGNSTDPEWGIACCFDCGAIHTHVTFPDEWREIERLLLLRPKQINRSWEPHESLADLRAQNAENGLGA